jgi:outer membrane protein TolC
MKTNIFLNCAFISCLLITGIERGIAQSIESVNVESVLKLAGANNLTVKEYQLRYEQALAEQTKAQEWWLPNIYAGTSTHFLTGDAMNTDGKIFTDVTRNNLWAGLGVSAEIDFARGKYDLLAAKQRAKAAGYQSSAERNRAILQALMTYFDMQADQVKYLFLQQLIKQADTLAQQVKVKVDAGLMYESEYLMASSNFSHLKVSMLQAKADWQREGIALASLLNLKNTGGMLSADTALIPLQIVREQTVADYMSNIEKRPEYLGLNEQLKSYYTLRKAAVNGIYKPKLRIGTDNGPFGGLGKTFQNTYQFNASLVWTLPLALLTTKGDIKRWDAQIKIQQNQVEQFRNLFVQEVTGANMQLQNSKEQVDVAKAALRTSGEAVYQGTQRQKLGTARPFEVFQSEQFYLQTQIDYLNAVANYNKAQYALYVAMGNNL